MIRILSYNLSIKMHKKLCYYSDSAMKYFVLTLPYLSDVAHKAIGLRTELTHARAVTLWAGESFHSQTRWYKPWK